MKTSELKSRISIMFHGYGHWKVTYMCRNGKVRIGITTNSVAIDRIKSDVGERVKECHLTLRQALLSIKP